VAHYTSKIVIPACRFRSVSRLAILFPRMQILRRSSKTTQRHDWLYRTRCGLRKQTGRDGYLLDERLSRSLAEGLHSLGLWPLVVAPFMRSPSNLSFPNNSILPEIFPSTLNGQIGSGRCGFSL